MSLQYHRPATIEEALRLSATPNARLIAGGTDVMVRVREGSMRPAALVSLSRVFELQRVEPGPPLVIGAGVKVADLEANQDVARSFPVLVQAARLLGSVQIRNAATIGGNRCNASPCADLAPPLLVNDARAQIQSGAGVREVPLEDFFVGPRRSVLEPGELLRAVVIDAPPSGSRAVFLKKGRVQMDIALGSVAVLLAVDGSRCARARVAAGSLGPRPMRLREVERVLEKSELDDGTIARAREAAEAEVRPISDVRASADYRRHLAGALLERAVRALVNGGRP